MEDIRRKAYGVCRTIIIRFRMKRYLITSIIAILTAATCFPPAVCAQEYHNTPVEVSKEKVRINGQVCYSHIVLEKQTLYSICKAYNVSAEDIYKFNPSVKENGLKKNSILIIPMASEPVKGEEAIRKSEPKTEQEAEPEQKPEPEPEQKTVSEKKPEPEPKKVEKAGGKRKIHTAKWYESLDDIAFRYGVSSEAIMKANNLTSKKLSKRQKLIIPRPGEYSAEESAEAIVETPAVSDTTIVSDTLNYEIPGSDRDGKSLFTQLFVPKKEIDMALLLPLKATGSAGSRQNLDFYSGVLLAVYDMAKEGISTNLNVYDIADGSIPAADEIIDSDVIIGPVASGDINRTFMAAPSIKALVSPLDPRAEHLAYSNNSLIHAPTPHTVQYNDLISWIKEDMQADDSVLFITEKGARQTDAVINMAETMTSSGLDYKPLSYSILEGRDITETLATMMTQTGANRVYIASESEAFVNDVVRNLNVMIHQKYNVVLYAPSKIRSFETIEVENFHNTKMRVSTGYYIDYDEPKVKEFLLHYRALFNTEPTQFAYQGYDLAKYFIGLCSKYGNRWVDKLDSESASMLQSNFRFEKTPTGGYVNNSVHRILYGDNWEVIKVR